MSTLAYLAVLTVTLGACSLPAASTPARSDRNHIVLAELTSSNVQNVLQAIEKLRPEWLTSRGPTSVTDVTPTFPHVYYDGQIVGTADYLRDVRVTDIRDIRFWPAGPAAARFGMGHPRGVIEISR